MSGRERAALYLAWLAVLGLLYAILWQTARLHEDLTNVPTPPATVWTPVPTPRPSASRATRSRPLVTAQPRHDGLRWDLLRQCENSGRYTSRPGDRYRGAYQFDRSTWESVGGTGDPATASPAEQDYRARLLYADRGAQPWPVCGRLLK